MSFNRAILREPGETIINGLTQHPSVEKPNYQKALEQHHQYANTIKKIGLFPVICKAQNDFPDGCFTEDTHLILPEVCIRLNPGAPSRANEPDSLFEALPTDRPYHRIPNMHTIDGGDILVAGKRIYVGLSERTKQDAVLALEKILIPHQYQVISVPVPEGLHLKSSVTCINPDTFLISPGFKNIFEKLHQELGENKEYFIIPSEEACAANVLPLNVAIIIPPNCPKTKSFIQQFYPLENIHEVDTSEFRKVDGALTCLSIPFRS